MKDGLTIEDVNRARADCEHEIMNALRQFEYVVGILPDSVYVEFLTHPRLGRADIVRTIAKCEVKVSI